MAAREDDVVAGNDTGVKEQDDTLGTADLLSDARGEDPADTRRPAGTETEPLLLEDALSGYRDRWEQIQIGFVDEPRSAVQRADGLVAEVMKDLASSFAEERSRLEGQWDRGDDVSTEDLRQALQRYRSFFQRLLAA